MIALQRSVATSRGMMRFIQHRSIVSTPPTVKVSFAEKVLGGVALGVSMLGIPTYIAVNLKNYQKS